MKQRRLLHYVLISGAMPSMARSGLGHPEAAAASLVFSLVFLGGS